MVDVKREVRPLPISQGWRAHRFLILLGLVFLALPVVASLLGGGPGTPDTKSRISIPPAWSADAPLPPGSRVPQVLLQISLVRDRGERLEVLAFKETLCPLDGRSERRLALDLPGVRVSYALLRPGLPLLEKRPGGGGGLPRRLEGEHRLTARRTGYSMSSSGGIRLGIDILTGFEVGHGWLDRIALVKPPVQDLYLCRSLALVPPGLKPAAVSREGYGRWLVENLDPAQRRQVQQTTWGRVARPHPQRWTRTGGMGLLSHLGLGSLFVVGGVLVLGFTRRRRFLSVVLLSILTVAGLVVVDRVRLEAHLGRLAEPELAVAQRQEAAKYAALTYFYRGRAAAAARALLQDGGPLPAPLRLAVTGLSRAGGS